jgi:hypothetical protein
MQDQDGSISSEGTGFKYIEQVEFSGDSDVKEEEGRSSNGEEQNYENRDWFAILLEVNLIYFQHANFVLF